MSNRPLVAVALPLLLVGALVGAWIATRDDTSGSRPANPAEASGETPLAVGDDALPAETASPTEGTPGSAPNAAPPPVAARAPADVPEPTPPPAEEVVPLEDLLRVPDDEAFPVLPEAGGAAGASGTDAFPESGDPLWRNDRVRIDASRKQDKNDVDGKTEREQVDAGASVRVDDSTRVRGGVRIERDPDDDSSVERETAPMIGIEKRF